jgi:tRNA (uracil-5-)-methyltransferase TRM9
MEFDTARRLVDLNREFYQNLAEPFAGSRGQVQPGAKRLLERIPPRCRVADFGCGNGIAARYLAYCGFRGRYQGFDFSPELLTIADAEKYPIRVRFGLVDLTEEGWDTPLTKGSYEYGLAFAVLHHIPGERKRKTLLEGCRRLLVPDGRLFLSTWQFARSEKLRTRTVPWSEIGMDDSDVDAGDFLLDWRREGFGLRYVHLFDAAERSDLAAMTGFSEIESFPSDGKSGNLADYAVWTPV